MLHCSYSTRVSAAWFWSCKLPWRGDECVSLPCYAQSDIFAIMSCCVAELSLFSSDVLTWSADSLYSVQWHINQREVRVEEHVSCVNQFRENVGLETWIWRQSWRHKQRTPNTNDHHIPLNVTPSIKIFCVRHYSSLTNPNTVNSSPTKITKKIFAKISHYLLWRNNKRLWTKNFLL